MVALFLTILLQGFAQTRKGTISVDGTDYAVYTYPNSYGGVSYDLRGNKPLQVVKIPVTLPLAPVPASNTYYDASVKHFADSMQVIGQARASWIFYKSWYPDRDDPEYQKVIIAQLKRNHRISLDYKH